MFPSKTIENEASSIDLLKLYGLTKTSSIVEIYPDDSILNPIIKKNTAIAIKE